MIFFKSFQSFNESYEVILKSDVPNVIEKHLASKVPVLIISKPGLGCLNALTKYCFSKNYEHTIYDFSGITSEKEFKMFLQNETERFSNNSNSVLFIEEADNLSPAFIYTLKDFLQNNKNMLVILTVRKDSYNDVNLHLLAMTETYELVSDNDMWRKSNKLKDANEPSGIFEV
jgi:hypothetical protein